MWGRCKVLRNGKVAPASIQRITTGAEVRQLRMVFGFDAKHRGRYMDTPMSFHRIAYAHQSILMPASRIKPPHLACSALR